MVWHKRWKGLTHIEAMWHLNLRKNSGRSLYPITRCHKNLQLYTAPRFASWLMRSSSQVPVKASSEVHRSYHANVYVDGWMRDLGTKLSVRHMEQTLVVFLFADDIVLLAESMLESWRWICFGCFYADQKAHPALYFHKKSFYNSWLWSDICLCGLKWHGGLECWHWCSNNVS